MPNDFKTLVTGGTGMVGSALKEIYPSAVYLSSKDADLRDYESTLAVFEHYKPHYVIHLAAKVGGVKSNTEQMGDFFTDNSWINTNVLHAAQVFKAKRVVSMLSTCVYPDADHVTYPLTEEQMHAGPPHESNFGYAHAKRMIEVQSRAYNKTSDSEFLCAIPNNIFGKHDNFHLEDGHVLPALIRKIWEAKYDRRPVELWGDGSPLREFTCANDIARAVLFLLWSAEFNRDEIMYNIGNTTEISIKEAAELVAKYLDFHGEIIWNTDMPSGQFRKPSSNKRFLDLVSKTRGDMSYTPLEGSIQETCEWFKNNYPYVRGCKSKP